MLFYQEITTRGGQSFLSWIWHRLRFSVWLVGCLFLAGLLASAVRTLEAQTLDTAILGTITDATNAVIPGASVTIAQPATGFTRTVVTSVEGNYEVRYLLPGEYVVAVTAPGFSVSRRTGIGLQGGQQARVNMMLQVGTVGEVIEVSARGPLLQTENATLGEVVTPERIVNLPLSSRRFTDLAALTPGVSLRGNASQTIVLAGGTRQTTMQMSFGGVTAVGNRWAVAHMFPSLDAIEEFKVQTGSYSAEYGGNGGANINVQFKSGTNSFHGTVYEFLRNNKLDARAYFRPRPLSKDVLRRNQFGAVVSGPIRENSTFFMASYEGERQTTQSAGTAIVLTPAMRSGDFSAVSGNVNDPFTGAPFPDKQIPAHRLNPVSVDLINRLMPLPNLQGSQNYATLSDDRRTGNQALTRIDHRFGEDQLSGHYLFQDVPTDSISTIGIPSTSSNRSQNIGAQYVRAFSPNVLNETRFGYYRKFTYSTGPRTNTDFLTSDWGIDIRKGGPGGEALTGGQAGFPNLNISGFIPLADTGNLVGDRSQTWQFVENLSVFRGTHAFKMGVDYRYLMLNATTINWPRGRMDFTNDISGNSAAAYMLGFPYQVLTPEGFPETAGRSHRWFFYFQDDWKVTSRLTLNLGVRYDLMGLPRDKNGVSRTLRWDLGTAGPVLWPEPGEVVDLWENEFWHIAPRLGFAYRLTDRTVIRGGYGIFTAANQFDNLNVFQLNPPAGGSITVLNDRNNPIATIQNPHPREVIPDPIFWNIVSLPPDRFRVNPYIQNWNFTLARELTGNDVLDVAYVGSKGTFLDTSHTNWNSPDPGPGPIQPRRPYPDYSGIRMLTTDGNSIYHALQVRYEHRLSRGLSATTAYTWSHAIDDTQDETNGQRSRAQNPRARGRANERASSFYDQRHNLVVGYVWDLPVGANLTGVAGAILGGWSMSGILSLKSGSPIWISQSGDGQNNGNEFQRPNLVPGQEAVLPSSERKRERWFNTAAYTRAVREWGNTPRNPQGLVGPGIKTLDTTFAKNFRMPYSEEHTLQFRTEFFNLFNTPQFSSPGGDQGTGSFGVITGTSSNNRLVQLALKYSF